MSGALWDWAVAAYARPGVESLCLALQDQDGQCAPYLLWAAYAGATDPAVLARAAALARRWEAETTAPLRALRRRLKGADPDIPDPSREALREQVKAAELAAERALLEALEALAPAAAPIALETADRATALRAAAAAWGRPADPARLQKLADTFSAP